MGSKSCSSLRISLTSGYVFRSLIYNCSIRGRNASHSSLPSCFRIPGRSGIDDITCASPNLTASGTPEPELTCALPTSIVEQLCTGGHVLRDEFDEVQGLVQRAIFIVAKLRTSIFSSSELDRLSSAIVARIFSCDA